MGVIPHSLISRDEDSRDHLVARGRAIEFYAIVEQSLGLYFARLSRMPEEYAGIVFFRIQNARQRNSMLGKLLKKRYGATYNIFWNSLVNILQQLDETRNQIVHWATIALFPDPGSENSSMRYMLTPPNLWETSENRQFLSLNDLYDFIMKCDFIARLVDTFGYQLSLADVEPTWQEIFQQPVTYPHPCTHPLYRNQTIL